MFLLTDSQITNERFLVYINDLLASGNIPDLFANDEVDGIINAVTNKVKALGKIPDRSNCWEYYINQIRQNLHVVLAFSPVGDACTQISSYCELYGYRLVSTLAL